MKSIYDILKGVSVEIPEDKKTDFEKVLFENYKTIEEVNKKSSRITELEGQLDSAKKSLKAFEGVDVNDLKGQITKLTQDLDNKEKEWQGKVKDMEFENNLDKAITGAKGRNVKAIKALLDVDSLKASKNLDTDLKDAITALKKDNNYLFDDEKAPAPYSGGAGTGAKGTDRDPALEAFRRGAKLGKKE